MDATSIHHREIIMAIDYGHRRAPLRRGRRIPLNVNLSPETHKELHRIGEGNRSAAIEDVVRWYTEHRARELAALVPDPVT